MTFSWSWSPLRSARQSSVIVRQRLLRMLHGSRHSPAMIATQPDCNWGGPFFGQDKDGYGIIEAAESLSIGQSWPCLPEGYMPHVALVPFTGFRVREEA